MYQVEAFFRYLQGPLGPFIVLAVVAIAIYMMRGPSIGSRGQ